MQSLGKEESLIHLEIQHAKKVAEIVHNKMDSDLIDDQKLLRKQNWINEKNNSFSYLTPENKTINEKRNRSLIISKKNFFESVPAIARVQFTRPPKRGPITANNSIAFAPISIIHEEGSQRGSESPATGRVFDTQDTKISYE